MSDTKDNGGFLRRVVRFVSHPVTDWADLSQVSPDSQGLADAKMELKAAIERRKRNDFVRRREFDMLRKVRREGLSEAVLGAVEPLGLDSEVRMSETVQRSDLIGMKAKIDAIERQMVGDSAALRFPIHAVSAVPQNSAPAVQAPECLLLGEEQTQTMPLALAAAPLAPVAAPPANDPPVARADTQPAPPASVLPISLAPPMVPAAGRQPSQTMGARGALYEDFGAEVSEIAYDAELDEAVMAFANANYADTERLLRELLEAEGARLEHSDTWLVLFDFYRVTGQQTKFEDLAVDYVTRFGLSAPQWFSLSRKAVQGAVAPAGTAVAAPSKGWAVAKGTGWVCPAELDHEAVNALRAQWPQLPSPRNLDWSHLRHIAPDAVASLRELLREWAGEAHEMHWSGGTRLQTALQDLTPVGARDVDPACWLLRLEMLRLLNRPDRFDEVAIDYCLTYEVSPPAWEPARCRVRLRRSDTRLDGQTLTNVGEVSTIFVEAQATLSPGMIEVASVDLSGEWVGDIGPMLRELMLRLGNARIVKLRCADLLRVDFNAAGDLLNWVLARRSEGRTVAFEEAHRLLALFFGAMGIDEHAQVKVRKV